MTDNHLTNEDDIQSIYATNKLTNDTNDTRPMNNFCQQEWKICKAKDYHGLHNKHLLQKKYNKDD